MFDDDDDDGDDDDDDDDDINNNKEDKDSSRLTHSSNQHHFQMASELITFVFFLCFVFKQWIVLFDVYRLKSGLKIQMQMHIKAQSIIQGHTKPQHTKAKHSIVYCSIQ